MNIGTLAQVIFNEDSASARRAKIRNRAAKDTSTVKYITYDGTDEDYLRQLGKVATPKQVKMTKKGLDQQKKLMGAAGKNANVTSAPGASYDNSSNTVAVNRSRKELDALNPDGTINKNSKLITHELQHKNQFDMINDYIGKGKNARTKGNKVGKRLAASYPNLAKLSSPSTSPSVRNKEMEKYNKNALEYDANAAAKRGYTSTGAGTKRAVETALGIRQGRQFKTTSDRGEYIATKVLPKDKQVSYNDFRQNKKLNQTREIDEKDLPEDILKMLQSQEETIKKQNQTINKIKKNNTQQQPVQQQATPIVQQPMQQQQMVQRPVVQQPVPQPQPVQQAAQYQPSQQVQTPYIQKYQQPQPVQQPVYQQPQPQMVQRPVAQQTQPVQQPVQQQMVQRQRPVQQANPNSINSVKPMNRQMAKNNNFRSA